MFFVPEIHTFSVHLIEEAIRVDWGAVKFFITYQLCASGALEEKETFRLLQIHHNF